MLLIFKKLQSHRFLQLLRIFCVPGILFLVQNNWRVLRKLNFCLFCVKTQEANSSHVAVSISSLACPNLVTRTPVIWTQNELNRVK